LPRGARGKTGQPLASRPPGRRSLRGDERPAQERRPPNREAGPAVGGCRGRRALPRTAGLAREPARPRGRGGLRLEVHLEPRGRPGDQPVGALGPGRGLAPLRHRLRQGRGQRPQGVRHRLRRPADLGRLLLVGRVTGAPPPERGPLDRALKLFGDVRAGEGATVLLMSLNVFVLLVAYYVLK